MIRSSLIFQILQSSCWTKFFILRQTITVQRCLVVNVLVSCFCITQINYHLLNQQDRYVKKHFPAGVCLKSQILFTRTLTSVALKLTSKLTRAKATDTCNCRGRWVARHRGRLAVGSAVWIHCVCFTDGNHWASRNVNVFKDFYWFCYDSFYKVLKCTWRSELVVRSGELWMTISSQIVWCRLVARCCESQLCCNVAAL